MLVLFICLFDLRLFGFVCLSVSSSSWCLGRVAFLLPFVIVALPWTVLLLFFIYVNYIGYVNRNG